MPSLLMSCSPPGFPEQGTVRSLQIALDIQPRDIHKVKANGKSTWILNDKPKKRAEVSFRSLEDSHKLDFLKAMQGELGSYLQHEAVEIAKCHNVPPE